MAVVKKYQEGKPITNPSSQSYKDFISEKLSQEKFTKKGESIARNVAGNFSDLFNQHKFSDVYSFDPIRQTYSIDTSKINDDKLKSIDWSGSKDFINKNVFGQFSGKADKSNASEENAEYKKYNSLLANWTNEYLSKQDSGENKPSRIGVNKNIKDIGNYVLESEFGGNEDLFNSSLSSMKSDDERKAFITNALRKNIGGYLEDYEKNKDFDNYQNIDLLRTISKDIDTNNWDSVKNNAKKLGWDLDSFLTKKESVKTGDQTTTTGNAPQDSTSGVTNQDFSTKLKDAGYTEVVPALNIKLNGKPVDWINDYFKNQNVTLLKNKENKVIAVKDNKLFDFTINDPFHQGYGYSWRNTEKGGVVYSPQASLSKGFFEEDPYKEQNIGRELQTNLEGYKVTGWSGEQDSKYSTDILGRRDFTKNLVLTKDGQKINLEKFPDGKYYYKGTLKPFEQDIKVDNYGKEITARYDYNKLFPNVSEVKPLFSGTSENYDSLISSLENNKKKGYSLSSQSLGMVKWALSNQAFNDNPELKERAVNILSEAALSMKNGGVFKAQYGGRAFQELVKKRKEEQTSNEAMASLQAKVSKGTTIHNLLNSPANTKDMLTVAAIAGDVVSFVPGLGVIGGLVSTTADLANDLQDGKIDNWGTHAANAGFTALAAVGLGGLKSALKLAKVTGKAEKSINIAKSISKLGDTSKDLSRIKELSTLAKKFKGAVPESKVLAEIEKIAAKKGDVVGQEIAEDLAKLVVSTDKGFDATKVLGKAGDIIGNKYVKGIMAAPTITAGVSGATEIGKELLSEDGKAGNITLEDVGNVLKAGSLGRNYFKNLQAVKAVKGQTTEIKTDSKIDFKVGDKNLSVSGESLPSKDKLTILSNPLSRSKNKAENLKKYKENIAKIYNSKNPKNPITADEISDVSQMEKGFTKELLLSGKPQVLGNQTLQQSRKQWELAKKAIEGGKGNILNVTKPKYQAAIFSKPKVVKKTAPKTKTPKMPDQSSSNNDFANYNPTVFLQEGGSLQNTKSGGSTGIKKGIDFSKIGKGLQKISTFVNPTDIANLGMYFNTRRSNVGIIDAQKRAAMAGIVQMPSMKQDYLRISDTITPVVDQQAISLQNQAGNISRNVSDIDKANAVLLEGASQAGKLKVQGNEQAVNRLDQLRAKQQGLNRATNQYNLDVIGQNRDNMAEAEIRTNVLDSDLIKANATALNNLIYATGQNIGQKIEARDLRKMFEMSQDPDTKAAYTRYNDVIDSETYYKEEFEKYQKSPYADSNITWETSPHRAKWLEDVDNVKKGLKPYSDKLETIRVAQAYGVPLNQIKYESGGKLKEKIDLENLKQENRLELQRIKQFYSTILKNNELMQKSLSKVFK